MDGVGKAAGRMIAGVSPLRAWVAVVSSVVCFALLVETAGLIPAVVVSVLVASRGSRDTPVREAVVFAVCLAVAMAVLFVVLLNQPIAIVRTW
jgi:hypothetical protein